MENTVICSTGHITPVPAAFKHAPEQHPDEAQPDPGHQREPTVNTAIEQITIWRVEKRQVRNAVSEPSRP